MASDPRDLSRRDFWQARYREGRTPWDLGGVSRAVVGLIEHYFPPAGAVLIPGCGRGHEALYLAERGYRVTAVDLAAEPLGYLSRKTRERKLDIEVLCADALRLPAFHDAKFDVFLEQTFFGAIDPSLYADYSTLAYRTLKPGGWLLGVFMEVGWAGGPPYNCPPALVLAQFPDDRWRKEAPEPVHPANPARPGLEYTLRLQKLAAA